MPSLLVERLAKTYPRAARPAVTEVSFEVHPGETVALLGPNGAGKTTTVKMVAGLIRPDAGRVRVLGWDMPAQCAQALRHIGAVLEGARNLYWRLSAYENLLYFGTLRGVSRRVLKERIGRLLAELDLSEFRDREVRHFSRGMQQKLALAAALIHDPELLLLDEPTLGLDVQAARKLEETVHRLAREEGKAILLTTHTMPLAERLAGRVLVMNRGRIVAEGDTSTLLRQFAGLRQRVQVHLAHSLDPTQLALFDERFPGLCYTAANGMASLTWDEPDQRKLLALLAYLDAQGVEIMGFRRREATLEEVFLAVTEGEGL